MFRMIFGLENFEKKFIKYIFYLRLYLLEVLIYVFYYVNCVMIFY